MWVLTLNYTCPINLGGFDLQPFWKYSAWHIASLRGRELKSLLKG